LKRFAERLRYEPQRGTEMITTPELQRMLNVLRYVVLLLAIAGFAVAVFG
jgi:hypothetical protein